MRIVLFSMYYWPELSGSAPYAQVAAEGLAERGHEVDVVAGTPHYPEWRHLRRRALASQERHSGVTIHRRYHYVPASPTALRRLPYEALMLATAMTSSALTMDADVVLGVVPALASGIAAVLSARLSRTPCGLVIHDLMGRGALQSGVGSRRVAQAVERIEHRLVSSSTGCLTLSDSLGRAIASSSNLDRPPVVALPCAVRDPARMNRATAREALGYEEGEFVCVHAGNMGQKQGLRNVIDAADLLMSESQVRFVLVGDGNDRRNLEDLVRSRRLRNVEFVGSVTAAAYDEHLVAADLLLLNQKGDIADMAFPSKLSAYLSAGRPVVASVAGSSDPATVIRRSQAGLLVEPDSPTQLARAIESLASDPNRPERMGIKAREYAHTHLSRSAMLDTYEDFVHDLLLVRGQRGSRMAGR